MSRARELADFLVASGNQLELKGNTGEDGCIKKNSASGRDELQIYVSGDAYDSGSRGSGIHLYGNSDSQHSGDMAFLTGPNDNGDARIIISGHEDKTRVTIGNAIFNYVDANDDQGLLNLKSPSSQPALYIEGASATEGDITCPPADAMQFGHWDKTASSGSEFTERFRMDTSGNLKIQDGDLIIGTAGHGIDFSATANGGVASSELLDDYEEGEFTYSIVGSSSGGWTNRTGYTKGTYTKVGNVVTIQLRFETTSKGSPSGTYVQITGFPFTNISSTSEANGQVQAAINVRGNGQSSDSCGTYGLINNNSAVMSLFIRRSNSSFSFDAITPNDISSNTEGGLQFSYITA